MCDDWRHDYVTFRDWVLTNLGSFEPGMSLDRIDNDGDYTPGNLRLVTSGQQARNKRTNRRLTHPATGETMLLCDWGKRLGLRPETIAARIDKRGWSLNRALSENSRLYEPLGKPRAKLTHPVTGECLYVSEWAKRLGIRLWAVKSRLARGWPLERALSEGNRQHSPLIKSKAPIRG